MAFEIGPKSRKELQGVHPDLVALVERAAQLSTIDFSVHDGLRTEAEHQENLRTGASKAKRSMHCIQPDGYGHAVDLVPWINGKLQWVWVPIYSIALAVRAATVDVLLPASTKIIWGGVWDRDLRDLPGDVDSIQAAVKEYCDRHPGPDFIDGPHFEIHT